MTFHQDPFLGGFSNTSDFEAQLAELDSKVFYKDGSRSMEGTLSMDSNLIIGNSVLEMNNQVSGILPIAGKLSLYSLTDKHIYIQDDSGLETQLSSGGNVLSASNFTTDNFLVRTDTTSGVKNIQQSAVTLDDSGNLTGISDLTATGSVNFTFVPSFTAIATNNNAFACQLIAQGGTSSELHITNGTGTMNDSILLQSNVGGIQADSQNGLDVKTGGFSIAGNIGVACNTAPVVTNSVPRFSGTTGGLLAESGMILDASDNVTGINDLTIINDLVVGGTISGGSALQSTGVIAGGLLTINADPTKFDISDGSGIIFNTTTLIATSVSWTGLTAQSFVYVGDESFISIDSSGLMKSSPTLPTNTQIRDNIFLGQIVHLDQINIVVTIDEQMTLLSASNQIRDFMRAIGQLNISGNICSSNLLLTIAKSAGTILSFGGNFGTDINNPHLPTSPAIDTNIGGGSPNVFAYRWQDGSNRLMLTNITPNEYDNGGGEAAPGVPGANKWTVQRIFTFSIGAMVIQQGQFVYNSKSEAINAVETEAFIVEADLAITGTLVAFLAVKGNGTDLSLLADAEFFQSEKYGSRSIGTAFGVSGPLSSTDLAITKWDGVSGSVIQNSGVLIDVSNNMTGAANLDLTGQLTTASDIVIDTSDANKSTRYGFNAGSGSFSQALAQHIAIGEETLAAANTTFNCCAIGFMSCNVVSSGTGNVGVGSFTLEVCTTGDQNVAVGVNALNRVTTGDHNTAVGDHSQLENIDGLRCTSIGWGSLDDNRGGDDEVGIGYQVLAGNNNAIGRNTCTGAFSYVNLQDGANNIGVGYQSGNAYTTTESDNIIIGNPGAIGESGIIRLGNSTDHLKCFVAGSRGITTDNADAVSLLIDSAGQIGTVSSSAIYKENIHTMDSVEYFVQGCRPVSFNYKTQPGKKTYGLIAEEMYALQPDLVAMRDGKPDTIQYHKLFGFMIKALQECYARIDVLENNGLPI